jgi:hypothetical protein
MAARPDSSPIARSQRRTSGPGQDAGPGCPGSMNRLHGPFLKRLPPQISRLQVAVLDLRINLGRDDGCVPEYVLDDAQIRTAFEQIDGEPVAHRVGDDDLPLRIC